MTKEQKSNYNEPEYTGNDWANERLATDKEQIEEMTKHIRLIRSGVCVDGVVGSVYSTPWDIATELYNAGYRKVVWHKVADGDLPQKQGFYLCYVHIYAFDRHGNEIDGYGYRVEPFVGIFNSLNATVVAWTELPEYRREGNLND